MTTVMNATHWLYGSTGIVTKDMDAFAERLNAFGAKCYDVSDITLGEMILRNDGETVTIPTEFGDSVVYLNHVSRDQFAEKYGIEPKTFWGNFSERYGTLHLRIEAQHLLAQNKVADKPALARFVIETDSLTGEQVITMRALLHHYYNRVNNIDVLNVTHGCLQSNAGEVQLQEAELFDEAMYVRFTLPDIQLQVGEQVAIAGLRVVNSEVGAASTALIPSIVFSNGVGITFKKKSAEFREGHLKKDSSPEDILNKLQETLPELLGTLEGHLRHLKGFEDRPVYHPDDIFDIMEKDFGDKRVSKKVWGGIREAFRDMTGLFGSGEQPTGATIIQAIASAPLYCDMSYTDTMYLEELIGHLIDPENRNGLLKILV